MPEGAGLLTFLALLIAAPFQALNERRQPRPPLSSLELNLRMASWGAAFIVLPLAALWLVGPGEGGAVLSGFAPGARWLVVAACGLWFTVAFAVMCTGWRACAGAATGLLKLRAFAKLAAGVFGLGWWVSHDLIAPRDPLALLLLFGSLWLTVTGLVRFLILLRLQSAALHAVEGEIAAREFSWDE